MSIQHLHFIGRKIVGHSKVRSELVLKTKDLSSTHPFICECLSLQVSEQQNSYSSTGFSKCQD